MMMSVFTISETQRRTVHTCSPRVSAQISITAAPLPAEHWLEEEMLIQPTEKKGGGRADGQRDLSSGSNTADSVLYSMHV